MDFIHNRDLKIKTKLVGARPVGFGFTLLVILSNVLDSRARMKDSSVVSGWLDDAQGLLFF